MQEIIPGQIGDGVIIKKSSTSLVCCLHHEIILAYTCVELVCQTAKSWIISVTVYWGFFWSHTLFGKKIKNCK